MRRTHLRHHENIAKRVLIHIAGFNLGLLMRKRFGVGKPRCLQGLSPSLLAAAITFINTLFALVRRPSRPSAESRRDKPWVAIAPVAQAAA